MSNPLGTFANDLKSTLGQNATAAEDPEAVKFWAPLKKDDNALFIRLCNSIYDFFRNTCPVPLAQTRTQDARNYVSPEMFWQIEKKLNVGLWDSLDDFEYMNDATSDKLLYAYYKATRFTVYKATREGGEEGAMPLITRGMLFYWLGMVTLGKQSAREGLVALLADEDNHFVDPYTDEPWKYAVPESCLQSLKDQEEEFVQVISHAQTVISETWETERAEILSERRAEAEAEEEAESARIGAQEARMRMMQQYGGNSIAMSNATANMVGNMSLAYGASRQAAWNSLQYRQNLYHMGSGQF